MAYRSCANRTLPTRYLLDNMDWLEEELGSYEDDYLIFDCPGRCSVMLYNRPKLLTRNYQVRLSFTRTIRSYRLWSGICKDLDYGLVERISSNRSSWKINTSFSGAFM